VCVCGLCCGVGGRDGGQQATRRVTRMAEGRSFACSLFILLPFCGREQLAGCNAAAAAGRTDLPTSIKKKKKKKKI
jgi:hypothetical protein